MHVTKSKFSVALVFLFSTIYVLFPFMSAYAFFDDSFFFNHCPNPGGEKIASYNDGLHAIIGFDQQQWGSDFVYDIGNNNFVQCFCPKSNNGEPLFNNGVGIQTNWLKASNISGNEKDLLLKNGWISVSEGSQFGLSAGEYLTKNINFQCGGNSCNCNHKCNTSQLNTKIQSLFNDNESKDFLPAMEKNIENSNLDKLEQTINDNLPNFW